MNNIEGKTEVVGKIFSSDYFFKIPYYQRPFAWDEDNFHNLIDDLVSSLGEQQYFLGTLVLHKRDERNNYDVVDGQQRLTSLLILTACLRDLIDDQQFKTQLQNKIIQEENKVDGIPAKPRIEVKDRHIFNEMVLSIGGTKIPKKATDLDEPENRYVLAIKIFRDKLLTHQQDFLQKFSQFVNQKCVMIYLSTTSFDDAFKLFTIVNDRGKQLRRIDILKAQNISPDVVVSESVRNSLAQTWESLEKNLGESTLESILHMMRFIYVKEKPQEDLYSEFEQRIYKKGLLGRGEAFIDQVSSYGNLYQQIFFDKDYLDTETEVNIKFKAMMHIMNAEFEASEWKACVLSYAKKFSSDGFYEFLLLVEKLYLQDWVKGVRKDERFGTYSRALREIEKASAASDVFKAVTCDPSSILKAIVVPNFYSTSYAKYFLLRLEVLASEQDAYKEMSAKSIEHIFPQTIRPGSSWSTDPDISDHKSVVNTIGNLILLSKGKNSAASNHDFATKKEKYLRTRVSDYPRSMEIMLEPIWTIAKIRARSENLSKTILNNP